MVAGVRIALTAAAALVAAVLASPTPAAQADAQWACVSNDEFNSVHIQTRETLEERWEVRGRGRQRTTPMYGTVIAYPWCGHPMGEAWVGIDYAQRGEHELVLGVVLYKRGANEPSQPPAPTEPPTVVPCDSSCAS